MIRLSEHSNLFLPICSFIVNFLLVIVFFIRKKINTSDTRVYSYLLICSFIESFLFLIINILAIFIYKPDVLSIVTFFEYLNKILYSIYIVWLSILLVYLLVIGKSKIIKYLLFFMTIFNIILITIIFMSDVYPYYVDNITNSSGPALNVLYFGAIIYSILIFVIIMKNIFISNIKSKYIPLICFLILITTMLLLRYIDPLFNFTSNIISFIMLIMYFTMENPDIKISEELEIAKNSADKANNAKTDFLSSMSHEIRTPLNAIVALSDDIYSRSDTLDKEVVEDAKDIVSASNTLLEIVGNILDISKIESEKLELNYVSYNPKKEIDTLARINLTRIGDKPINFNYQMDENIPYLLLGDKVRIKQIINNLLSNAFKYTNKGEVTLTVKSVINNDLCNLIIIVKDSGIGISKEKRKNLFNKFERLNVEEKVNTEGTGLGLAITKRLVEMMNGTISVSSVENVGSTFMVQLPQKIEKLKNDGFSDIEEYENEDHNTFDFSNKKVLVVDDNKLNIKVAKKVLDKFNLEVDSASSAEECISKVKEKNYDLILMDIMMPDVNGEVALKILKEDQNFITPVVALTADALVGSKERYLSLGFDAYLSKPFTKKDIEKVLVDIFSKMDKKYVYNPNKWNNVDGIVIVDDEVI